MTQTEIYEFLKQGSLIRLPSGKVRLWKGALKPVNFKETSTFSIAYQEYFSTHLLAFQAENPVLETEVSELKRQLASYVESNPAVGAFHRRDFQEPEKNLYQESFQAVQGKIQRGEIEKAVPIVFAQNKNRPGLTDLAKMLFHVLDGPKQLYVYGVWTPEEGILGATPETLFHVQGKLVQSMAMAGTAMKTATNRSDDLLRDPKEMKEHRLVVEDIQKQLTPLGWVKTLPTEVAEFPMLYHLKTEIAVEASTISIPQLVRSLHPTAALGVFPRNYGIQWMSSLPYQKNRGLFGAPIVFSLSHNESLGLVAIRNLIWNAEGSKIGSGGGLVDSSVFEKEWGELKLKRDSVLQILGIA